MTTNAIEVHKLNFAYPHSPLILENIHWQVDVGDFVALVGPNGGGKSTLLKIILGLLKPQQGQVRILGQSLDKNRGRIGYVPQFADFSRDYPISVEETVLLGRLGKTRAWLGYNKQDRDITQRVMQETYVTDLRSQRLGTLSGGQLQRVLIARALACQPEILILDEPTANIDMRTEEDIFDLLKTFNQRMTIIVVSHDIGFISSYVSHVACLNKTLMCHHTDALQGELIQEVYDQSVRSIHHHHEAHFACPLK